MRLSRCVLYGILAISMATACSRKKDDGTDPIADKASLPSLTIRDDTPDLMLTWVDDKGETHVELKPTDVPEAGRSLVRVVVADREDGTRDLFYVADLTQKNADGTYATRTMSRRAWESELEKRRSAYLAKVAPAAPNPNGQGAAPAPPGATADRPPASGLTVIIYGASWCKPCHQAADYLKSKGIAVVVKDVEENPGAGAEMQEKLARSGQRGGSIPVIDVRGQILVGYSQRDLDRALAKAQSGTVL